MRKSNREVNGEKVFRYSIRKYHFGAASVAVAALMFFANGAVKADTLPVSPATANTERVNAGVTNLTEGVLPEKSLEAEGNKEIVAPEPAEETSNKKDGAGSSAQGAKEIKVSDKAVIPANRTEEINKVETNGKEKEVVTNKDKLESLLKEIDQLNLKDYTEDTVKALQEKVAKAKEVLVNATTQKEIDLAYNALVGYKNAGLKRVPKPKGELTPKPDTTNGKATVGIKAENTEPNGTNIAGHNHSLNGTTRFEGSGFRDANTELTDVEIGRWNATRKKFDEGNVYGVYPGDNLRNNSLKIKVKSPNANITKLTVTKKEGGNFPGEHTTGIGGKEADLYFEGNLPNSGSWLMEVTAETTKGIKKFEFGVYTHFKAPTIKTENSALVGKANGKPDIDVEIPFVPKLPEGSRMMLYVVGHGAEDYGGGFEPDPAYSLVKAKKQIASGKEGTGGKKTVTITENDYTVEKLGTEPFKVLTVIELIGSDGNYKEDHRPGLRGSYYSSNRNATEAPKEVNKKALITALSDDTTTKGTPAYYNAEASKKATYDQAVTAGKAVLARDNATQTEVNDAVSAITNAKNALNGNYVSSTSSTVQPSHPVQNDSSAQASPSVPTSQPTQPAGEGQPSTPVQASSTDTTVTPDEDSIRDKEPSTLSADQSRTDRSMEDVAKEESPVSAKQQLDKSELRTLSYELEERLKALTKVSDAKIDAAKTVLLDAKKAISDSDLTEQGLRDAVEAVKKALASLKDVKVNDVDSKTAQDKSDVKKVAEDSKDSDKMSETYSVPTGVFVAGLLALLGVIIFWLIRRKKDSELKQLSIELTKVLEQQDVAKADKKVLAKAQKLLQETLDFVKEESGSAETEAKLVEQLKAIISKLK